MSILRSAQFAAVATLATVGGLVTVLFILLILGVPVFGRMLGIDEQTDDSMARFNRRAAELCDPSLISKEPIKPRPSHEYFDCLTDKLGAD